MLSWYPPGVADEHGKASEDLVPAVMDAAHRHSIKVTGERSVKLLLCFFTSIMLFHYCNCFTERAYKEIFHLQGYSGHPDRFYTLF